MSQINILSIYQFHIPSRTRWHYENLSFPPCAARTSFIGNIRNQPDNLNSLSNNDIRCIVEDNFGHLWIGTFYGLSRSAAYSANLCGIYYRGIYADDYITKPFNVKLLISRCNNIVKNRKALIEKFKNQQESPLVGNAMNQADQELIAKATSIIKKNFESQEFNMNMLATELALGRNKLYARLKELTGLTSNEFTLKLKLDESMNLLKNNPELNISEISDRLGFSSTQYFSKCFKSVYGVSPLTFRKSSSTPG